MRVDSGIAAVMSIPGVLANQRKSVNERQTTGNYVCTLLAVANQRSGVDLEHERMARVT